MDVELLANLLEHRKAVDAVAQQGRALLDRDAPADAIELSRIRWTLMRVLTAYQQFKHRKIFEPAIARGEPHLVRMAEALKADCTTIGEAFADYVRTWTLKGSSGHWPEYRQAALAMNDRLRRHLEREERNVQSLLRASRVSAAPVWPSRSD